MHVWMPRSPEQSYVHEQAKNRTARNGHRGCAQALVSPQDALIRNAMHLHGVRAAVVRYEQAAPPMPPTPPLKATTTWSTPATGSGSWRRTCNSVRSAIHRRFHPPPRTLSPTNPPALTLAAAETRRYDRPDVTDRMTRRTRPRAWPGCWGSRHRPYRAVAVLDNDDADGPPASGPPASAAIRRLLDRAGLPPAAAEALRQHVEATAPAIGARRAGSTTGTRWTELMQAVAGPARRRTRPGIAVSRISEGAEGMRICRSAADRGEGHPRGSMGYPAAGITPVIARDILGEAVGDHLTATNTGHFAARDDIDSAAVVTGPVRPDAQNPDTQKPRSPRIRPSKPQTSGMQMSRTRPPGMSLKGRPRTSLPPRCGFWPLRPCSIRSCRSIASDPTVVSTML